MKFDSSSFSSSISITNGFSTKVFKFSLLFHGFNMMGISSLYFLFQLHTCYFPIFVLFFHVEINFELDVGRNITTSCPIEIFLIHVC